MDISISEDGSMVLSFSLIRDGSKFYMSYDDIDITLLIPLRSFLSQALQGINLKNSFDLMGNYSYKEFVYNNKQNILTFQTGDKYSQSSFIYNLNDTKDRNIVKSFISKLDNPINVFLQEHASEDEQDEQDEQEAHEDELVGGNLNDCLNSYNKKQLIKIAREKGISGISRKNKYELCKLIQSSN